MENIKYGRRREGRWTPIRAKTQDTRANPNSWETHLVRKRWGIGLLRALNPRMMTMMMMMMMTMIMMMMMMMIFHKSLLHFFMLWTDLSWDSKDLEMSVGLSDLYRWFKA